MITYSLQNFLLDDPELDDEPLLGPIVPMRWMSNLFRLAFLEETDRQLLADGLDPRHQPEIRRLRRMSMAPAVGRFYPVGAESADAGRHITPDQARHLVESWRTRQLVPHDDFLDDDDPDEYLEDEYLDDDDAYPDSALDDDSDELDENDFEDSDEWSAGDFREESEPGLAARFGLFAAITLFAALLIVAATWLIKARIQSTPPHSAPVGINSTTKIVPSAVPRNPILGFGISPPGRT